MIDTREKYRQIFTINKGQVSSPIENCWITLNGVFTGLFNVKKSDIEFRDKHDTKLEHSILKFNNKQCSLLATIKVPIIEEGTSIYMNYKI